MSRPRALKCGLQDTALALGVVVLKKMMGVLREVRNGGEQRGFFVVLLSRCDQVTTGAADSGGTRCRVFSGLRIALFSVRAAVAEVS